MAKPFKEFAAKEIIHAKQVIEWMDSGEWKESPELRHHYMSVIQFLERKLGES